MIVTTAWRLRHVKPMLVALCSLHIIELIISVVNKRKKFKNNGSRLVLNACRCLLSTVSSSSGSSLIFAPLLNNR